MIVLYIITLHNGITHNIRLDTTPLLVSELCCWVQIVLFLSYHNTITRYVELEICFYWFVKPLYNYFTV